MKFYDELTNVHLCFSYAEFPRILISGSTHCQGHKKLDPGQSFVFICNKVFESQKSGAGTHIRLFHSLGVPDLLGAAPAAG